MIAQVLLFTTQASTPHSAGPRLPSDVLIDMRARVGVRLRLVRNPCRRGPNVFYVKVNLVNNDPRLLSH